jgi:hypothetical protein
LKMQALLDDNPAISSNGDTRRMIDTIYDYLAHWDTPKVSLSLLTFEEYYQEKMRLSNQDPQTFPAELVPLIMDYSFADRYTAFFSRSDNSQERNTKFMKDKDFQQYKRRVQQLGSRKIWLDML